MRTGHIHSVYCARYCNFKLLHALVYGNPLPTGNWQLATGTCLCSCPCRVLCEIGCRPRRPNLKLYARVTYEEVLRGLQTMPGWGVLFSFASFRFLSQYLLCSVVVIQLQSVVGTPSSWLGREGPAARMRRCLLLCVVTMTSYFRLPFAIVSRCVGV